ncbi:hypothetical protein [Streptomyces sp. NBC_01089]|uniref:hypothetical protein n=1 Tax=Streptomyces sp. NBC_01089 TaxID=2903747 RepID=UPI003866C0CF|nr:hypothetical protein OG510_36145 [Streptomyces sp. NBC_01089]
MTRISLSTALAAMTVLAGLPLAVATAAPATAQPPAVHGVRSTRAPEATLECNTWVHHNDPLAGGVDCTNRSAGPVTFHANIICGVAPDVTGNSVTLRPGQVGESSGHCAFYSTGIGGISWTVE